MKIKMFAERLRLGVHGGTGVRAEYLAKKETRVVRN